MICALCGLDRPKTFPMRVLDGRPACKPACAPEPGQLLVELVQAVTDVTSGDRLRAALAAYEATGDHDHGRGPLAPGAPCGTGDECWVSRARAALATIDGEHT